LPWRYLSRLFPVNYLPPFPLRKGSAERLAHGRGDAESIRKELPGAVVLVGRHGKVVAQGIRRAHRGAGTRGDDRRHIFDLASLTKVVATTTSIMILIEQGKFD
jgi:CubicO group peptidase (beta-lactamase class C family)